MAKRRDEKEKPTVGGGLTQRLKAIDACEAILAAWANSGGGEPYGLPSNRALAAAKWVDWFMEPPSAPSETPRATERGLIEPYVVRVTHCLRMYLAMPIAEQREVQAATEDGIHWRADPMPYFRVIIRNTLEWQDMSPDERREHKSSLAAAILGIARRPEREIGTPP